MAFTHILIYPCSHILIYPDTQRPIYPYLHILIYSYTQILIYSYIYPDTQIPRYPYHPSGHIPHGRFDSDGRLEGKVCFVFLFHIFHIDKEPHQGELVITWVEGLDREEEKPNMEVFVFSP